MVYKCFVFTAAVFPVCYCRNEMSRELTLCDQSNLTLSARQDCVCGTGTAWGIDKAVGPTVCSISSANYLIQLGSLFFINRMNFHHLKLEIESAEN